MTTSRNQLHLGVAIDGHGAHPAAWRTLDDAAARGLWDGTVTTRHAQRAAQGLLDFVTLDDALAVQDGGEGRLRGRVDALLTLAKVGPLTSGVGLIPTITTTHTEPFNVSKNIATLDWVSLGRGGWRVEVSTSTAEADHFGRHQPMSEAEAWAEAADAVEVVRRLWDSWEDDAIIRDRPTGRFIDRDRVHYIDFEGARFNVRGPSIVPRSPQGQPLVLVDACGQAATTLAVATADLIVIDAETGAAAHERVSALRTALSDAGRDPAEVFILVRADVVFGATSYEASARLAVLDRHEPWAAHPGRLRRLGTACAFAELAMDWQAEHDINGFVLAPAVLATDLGRIVDELVPTLQAAGGFRKQYTGVTLREHFGLARPTSRYATASAGSS